MPSSVRLYLDPGDAFTKALARSDTRRTRVRFPSVVARGLLQGGPEMSQLLLDAREALLRPTAFQRDDYPRTRSFPGADAFVQEVRQRPPGPASRFAGRLAAVYGADREMLGTHPTPENIDALVHKALMLLCGDADRCDVEATFVVDAGAKALAMKHYVETLPKTAVIERRSYRRREPRRLEMSLRGNLIDAAQCIAAVLPAETELERLGRLLFVDVGYFRTKLAVVSRDGCEHQEQLDRFGAFDCVRRILRDEQEQGLVEDEYAVLLALEEARSGVLQIAGRRFDIQRALGSARVALEQELARAVQRVIVEDYGRGGDMCRAVVVIGGGAALMGQGLAQRLQTRELGVSTLRVGCDTPYWLVEGAERCGNH
jgi:hypothetical protein